MKKKKVWGKVLVVEPRLNYYSLPVVHLDGEVISDEQGYLDIMLSTGQVVRQRRQDTLCLRKKTQDVNVLIGNFQSSLNELKIELVKLKSYDLTQTKTVIMAENPLQPSGCLWEQWEVDVVTRAVVMKATQTTVTLEIRDEQGQYTRCPSNSIFACESEEQWQNIEEKYFKLQKSQKYLIAFLCTLQSYDEQIKQSRMLKALDKAPSTKVREFKEALISNPELSLRSTGSLLGLSPRSASRYYQYLKENLSDVERQSILRKYENKPIKLRRASLKGITVLQETPVEETLAYKQMLAENQELKNRFCLLAKQMGLGEDIAAKIVQLEQIQSDLQKAEQETQVWRQKYESSKKELPRKDIRATADGSVVAQKIIEFIQEAEAKETFKGRGFASVREFVGDLLEIAQSYHYPIDQQTSKLA